MNADFRKKENMHILLWLVKDFSWLMDYKTMGIAMAAPTLILSCWLTWKSRRNRADWFHNVAVTFWICGNVIWMCGEFFCDDCTRDWAMPAFLAGFVVLTYYYISLLSLAVKNKKATP